MKRSPEEIAELKKKKSEERAAEAAKLSKIKEDSKRVLEHIRKSGLDYEIEHTRPMVGFTAFEIFEDGSIESDEILSRDEFNEAVKKHLYSSEVIGFTSYGDFVSPHGGFTRVTIYDENDNIVACGKHNFKKTENYFRSLGIVEACRRAGIEVK